MARCPIGAVTFQPLTWAIGGKPSFGGLVRQPNEPPYADVNRVAHVQKKIIDKIAPTIAAGVVNERNSL